MDVPSRVLRHQEHARLYESDSPLAPGSANNLLASILRRRVCMSTVTLGGASLCNVRIFANIVLLQVLTDHCGVKTNVGSEPAI